MRITCKKGYWGEGGRFGFAVAQHTSLPHGINNALTKKRYSTSIAAAVRVPSPSYQTFFGQKNKVLYLYCSTRPFPHGIINGFAKKGYYLYLYRSTRPFSHGIINGLAKKRYYMYRYRGTRPFPMVSLLFRPKRGAVPLLQHASPPHGIMNVLAKKRYCASILARVPSPWYYKCFGQKEVLCLYRVVARVLSPWYQKCYGQKEVLLYLYGSTRPFTITS